jgi:hypothetical protein
MLTGAPAPPCVHAEDRERQQRDGDAQEDDGQRHQQDGQRDLVRRLLPLGAFDHGDHAVDEGLAGIDGDAHDQPVGQHARAAGHGREVAAGFADHRRRFAGDGAFVDRGHAFDDLAVGGTVSPASTSTTSPLRRSVSGLRTVCHSASVRGACSFLAQVSFFRPRSDAACALLRPSASAFGESWRRAP